MSNEDHRLTNQIDPLADFNNVEEKQIRGFELSGDKKLVYLGHNDVLVTELPSNVEYIMQYTNLSRMLKVFGFQERSLDLSLDKLLAYNEVYYRFDHKTIFINQDATISSPVLAHMSNAIDEYDQALEGVEAEMDFDELRMITNKL